MGEGKAKDVVGIPGIGIGDVGICIQATPDKFCKKIDKVERLFVRISFIVLMEGIPIIWTGTKRDIFRTYLHVVSNWYWSVLMMYL